MSSEQNIHNYVVTNQKYSAPMRRIRLFSVTMISIVLLASCGDDNGFQEPIDVPTAQAQFFNAVVDSPNLRITGEGSLAAQTSYGSVSTIVRAIPQADRQYQVNYLLDSNEVNLFSSVTQIDINNFQTIVLTGTMAAAAPVVINTPPFDFAEDSTEARLTFLNASPGLDTATVTLTNPIAENQTITMPYAVATEKITTTASENMTLEVRDVDGNLLFASGAFELAARSEQVFALIDYFGPGLQTVQLVNVNSPNFFPQRTLPIQVRSLNLIADRGPVDFLINDAPLASNQNFSDIGQYQDAAIGDNKLAVTALGDPTDELFSTTENLNKGRFVTFGVSGLVNDISHTTSLDDRRPVATHARMTITHLSPTFSTNIDIYVLPTERNVSNSFPLINGMDRNTTFSGELSPGTYNVSITTAGTNDTLVGPTRIDLEPASYYTLVIADSDGGGAPITLQFFDDF